MNARTDVQTAPAPTLRQLAKTTAIALLVAVALLVTMVLPAEYGIDPLGSGRRLGLTEIASPTLTAVDEMRPAGAALVPVAKGPLGEYPADFKLDVFEITLQPYEYVEYKYHLEQGATMLYAWNASAPVIQDFHGERASGAADGGAIEESFDKQDRRQASGTLTAPFTGIHGWYWENPSGSPITVRLTSSGFYASAVEIRSDRTRHPRTLRAVETLSAVHATSPGQGSQ
jgi:hypothetical protein